MIICTVAIELWEYILTVMHVTLCYTDNHNAIFHYEYTYKFSSKLYIVVIMKMRILEIDQLQPQSSKRKVVLASSWIIPN